MSRKINRAPLALSSDGEVLLNVAMSDVAKQLGALLSFAEQGRGAVFIGIVLNTKDCDFIRNELRHALRDATAWVVTPPSGKLATSSRRRRSSP